MALDAALRYCGEVQRVRQAPIIEHRWLTAIRSRKRWSCSFSRSRSPQRSRRTSRRRSSRQTAPIVPRVQRATHSYSPAAPGALEPIAAKPNHTERTHRHNTDSGRAALMRRLNAARAHAGARAVRCTMTRIRPVLVVLGKGCNQCNTLYCVATCSTVATKPDSTDEHAGGSERHASYQWL